ncbi:hypothetical protein HYPSUDRAFT_135165 [Hypholoma sublateritium FD-334 SS-4]|uniref:MBOAT-domain-containing protein n=1 Tax=Hypholoma sublateritium (strain FD-334 SS-4) TaxID=945553 RepID=A0A0D2LCN3_HYPSF|nr:hypothetical protein HYPSUDRAFT_135165 [Hypholoma sublateritium FD-334 SS-4]
MAANHAGKTVHEASAHGVARLTVHIPSAFRPNAAKAKLGDAESVSRLGTIEFRIYYVVVAVAIPVMVWIPMTLSDPSNRNYPYFSGRLSPGWINGRAVDNSDAQYRSFRDNFSILCKAAAGYLSMRQATRYLFGKHATNSLYRIPTNAVLSILMIIALHGSSSAKILFIMSVNYLIAKRCRGSRLAPLLTWAFNVLVLFANDTYRGYQFAAIHPGLAFLDSFSGIYPRWHISFNITMLRLISFNMDYHWACKAQANSDTAVTTPDEKQRVTVPHSLELYSPINYLSYILYPPLYIAGPILTFNDFMWQHRKPTAISIRSNILYLFRFACCYLTMEFILHYMYVVAIKDRKAWLGDSSAEIALLGFWNLIVVWLKLLIPWRFFRAWALLDGIDPPENMVRCMVNNYSTFGFWRSWHRSYNLWIIRYIYVPLGGSKHVLVNTLLVFSFVALWHDLTFRLLAWGWLISLFVVPELLAGYLLPAAKFGKRPWFRHVCAAGGVVNMLLMVVANLIGFVLGTDGTREFFAQLLGTLEGLRFMAIMLPCMFVAVQLMFEYREEEFRQGIVRRC